MHGGNEDLEAVAFLQELNTVVHRGAARACSRSPRSPPPGTGSAGRSTPAGLGFTHKWNMGWMHDTLDYWSTDPLLPALAPQPAHLRAHLRVGRALRAAAQPRRGGAPQEAAARQDARQRRPRARSPTCARSTRGCGPTPASSCCSWAASWPSPTSGPTTAGLDWSLARPRPRHAGVQRLVGDLNAIQAHHPALHRGDGDPAGFAWLAVDDADRSTLRLRAARARHRRRGRLPGQPPGPPRSRTTGSACRRPGRWRGLVTSDDARYGGSGSWVPHLERRAGAVARAAPTSAMLTIPPAHRASTSSPTLT